MCTWLLPPNVLEVSIPTCSVCQIWNLPASLVTCLTWPYKKAAMPSSSARSMDDLLPMCDGT